MSSTEDRIKQLANEHLDLGSDPDFDARLGDAGVSSVDAVGFFRVVNEEFSLGLAPEDCLQFKTLRLLADFIDARAG